MIPVFRIDQIHRLTTEKKRRLYLEKIRAVARSLSVPNVVKIEDQKTVDVEFAIQLWIKEYTHTVEYMDQDGEFIRRVVENSNLNEESLESLLVESFNVNNARTTYGAKELIDFFGLERNLPFGYNEKWGKVEDVSIRTDYEWVETRDVIPGEWEDKGIRLWLGQDTIVVPLPEATADIWGLRAVIPGYIDGSEEELVFKGSDFVRDTIDDHPSEAKYYIWEIK